MLQRNRLLGFLFGVVMAGAAARATAWLTTRRHGRKPPPLRPDRPTNPIEGLRKKGPAGR